MTKQQLTTDQRRGFLRKSAVGALGGAMVTSLQSAPALHAAGDDVIKVGLIGCGGRGTGAAVNAMRADANHVGTRRAPWVWRSRQRRQRRRVCGLWFFR